MNIAIFLLRIYQRGVSPLTAALGAQCRYFPSCSAFAVQAFQTAPWPQALWRTVCRLASCHPWRRATQNESLGGEACLSR